MERSLTERKMSFLDKLALRLMPEEKPLIDMLRDRNKRIIQAQRLNKEIAILTRKIDSYQSQQEENLWVGK
jgi:hypothetical protein